MPVFCKNYQLEFSVPKSFIPKLFNAAKDGDQTALEEINEAGDHNNHPTHDTGYGTFTTQTPLLPKPKPQYNSASVLL